MTANRAQKAELYYVNVKEEKLLIIEEYSL